MNQSAGRSRSVRNRWFFLGLLLILIAVLVGLYLWLGPGLAGEDRLRLLPVSLHSLLKANYAKDPMTIVIPPMTLNLIGNALSDSGGSAGVAGRVDTLISSLKTPVPSLTLPGSTVVFTPTPTQTPTPGTPTGTVSFSPTPISSPSQTATSQTDTVTLTFIPGLPTFTMTVLVHTKTAVPTRKPNPSATLIPPSQTKPPNTPSPSRTLTATNTATRRPPTATRLPYPPPPTQPPPTAVYP